MKVDLKLLSEIAANLGMAINAVTTSENKGIDSSKLETTFDKVITMLDNGLSQNEQLSLELTTDTSVKEPVKSNEPIKEGKAIKHDFSKNTEKNKKQEHIVLKKKKDKPVEEKKESGKSTESSDQLTPGEAYEAVFEEIGLYLEKNKAGKITAETKAQIITTIKAFYGRVHPASTNSTDKGAEDLYYHTLMPAAISKAKEKGLEIILDERNAATKTEEVKKEETPAAPVVETKTPETEKKVVTTSESKETTKADEVAAILEVEKAGAEVKTEASTSAEEESTEETSDEEDTSEDLPSPSDVAALIVETLMKDGTPKEGVQEASMQAISPAVEVACKQIFEEKYGNNKELVLNCGDKSYLAHDYLDIVVKKVKADTGGFEKSPLVKVSNKNQIKIVKTWVNTAQAQSA